MIRSMVVITFIKTVNFICAFSKIYSKYNGDEIIPSVVLNALSFYSISIIRVQW